MWGKRSAVRLNFSPSVASNPFECMRKKGERKKKEELPPPTQLFPLLDLKPSRLLPTTDPTFPGKNVFYWFPNHMHLDDKSWEGARRVEYWFRKPVSSPLFMWEKSGRLGVKFNTGFCK